MNKYKQSIQTSEKINNFNDKCEMSERTVKMR